MKTFKTKFGSEVKIFTDNIEDEALKQIKNLANNPFYKDSKIRIMPDVHSGKGCTIGTTMTVKDKISPKLIGVDIGCGVTAFKLQEKDIDLKKLDAIIKYTVPSGKNVHKNYNDNILITKLLNSLKCKDHVDIERAKQSIGTLGGGNHFIEVDKDKEGNLYLIIHSGSRSLGYQVAKYYEKVAIDFLKDSKRKKIQRTINRLKAAGRQKEIQSAINKIKQRSINEENAVLIGKNFDNYIEDVQKVTLYALLNRTYIAYIILRNMNLNFRVKTINTIHNFIAKSIDDDTYIVRKGAISALLNKLVVIPINMKEGTLLCRGLGNVEWNCSAPHGAGRLMSRKKAFETLNYDEYVKSMSGIYSSSVTKDTLDESPMAYKPIDEIINNIKGTVEVIDILKPIYNFKAS
jgi:RNA-splicing ligase RtcB